MSLFEDVVEVHYNADKRVSGGISLATLSKAVGRVARPLEDICIVITWNALDGVAAPLEEYEFDRDLLVPKEHIETRTRQVEREFGHEFNVHGVESGEDFAIVMDPSAVNYENDVIDDSGVVAIDFE
jgi:hypothetical protein